MKTLKYSFIAFIFLCQWVNAQKYEPGYYINATGDTVREEIFLQKKNGAVVKVQTKSGKDFYAGDVKGAGQNNLRYVTKMVTMDKSPKGGRNVSDTIFVALLVAGKQSLFFAPDEFEKTHLFIENEDGSIDDLTISFLDLGDGIHFQQLPSYKDALKKNFANCPTVLPQIDKARLSRDKIKDIFVQGYQCKFGVPAPVSELEEESYSDAGIIAGASLTSLSFTDKNKGVTYPSFGSSTNITAGVFLDIHFARVGQFVIKNELLFKSYSAESAPTVSTLFQDSYTSVLHISASYIKYNLILNFPLSRAKLKPYINLGFTNGLLLSHSDNDHRVDTSFGQAPVTTDKPFLGAVKTYEPGGLFGIGIQVKNLSIEGRLERSIGLRPETTFDSPTTSVYLLAGYKLKDGYKTKKKR